ncbi:MAG: MBL fold metallo-hydrolase [Spirochaetales bacterium]|nr:MBL fold metallo-hydrolase [Spirochaetales bacterium]
MKIIVLGSGTSSGVPAIGCSCAVCRSENPLNKRTRSSIIVETEEVRLLVDSSPELRIQLLREGIDRLDGVLYTHGHADHLHGIDDLRPLSFGKDLPLYGKEEILGEIVERFPYIFGDTPQKGGGKPRLRPQMVKEPFRFGDIKISPILVYHGIIPIYGYRLNDFVYITDCSRIPEESYPLLENCRAMILGGLRYRPHETHFTIDEAVEVIKKTGPGRAWLTHINHDVDHNRLKEELPYPIEPAYDGLSFVC